MGLLPFIICLWLFKLIGNDPEQLFNPQQAFQFYSVIILTFLAGTLWRKESNTIYSSAQIISNLFCLYAYIWLFMPLFYTLIFLPLGYVGLLATEYLLLQDRKTVTTSQYFIMRLTLTTAVVVLHAIALLAWF
ncbi:hypothetical protein GCM10007916_02480 [Psychromonas marina]|uniref:DUF3429 domain-containing protein n=2 Tax=Psychromonas marina TaxID=88364 RepID=A0ABQ6DVQ9_9GAMM|nr:hypothetical protein GCM10007916_02480 [Psychromonas marina]